MGRNRLAHIADSMGLRIRTKLYTATTKVKSQPTHCTPRSCFPDQPDRLQPAGDLFDPFALLLTDGIAEEVPRGSAFN